MVSDFEERLGFPADGEAPAPRLVAFLGSTIGNLEPGQRAAFLARVRDRLRPGDFFLLGTDLVKDPATLVAAYDDEAGVTAEFNKNVLAVLNAELGADFDLDAFEHVAVWNADAEWIEMRLRSGLAQIVRLPGIGLTVEFAEGEEMRTEISAKFRREGVAAELAAAGFAMRSWWTDSADQFGLSLSVPAPVPAAGLSQGGVDEGDRGAGDGLPGLIHAEAAHVEEHDERLPADHHRERGDEPLEPVRAQPRADRFERRLDPADAAVAALGSRARRRRVHGQLDQLAAEREAAGHPVAERRDQRGDAGTRVRLAGGVDGGLDADVHRPEGGVEEQLVEGGEIGVDRPAGDVGGGGDVVDRRIGSRGEQPRRRLDDGPAGAPPLRGPPRLGRLTWAGRSAWLSSQIRRVAISAIGAFPELDITTLTPSLYT